VPAGVGCHVDFSIRHWKEGAANRVRIHKRRLQNTNNLKAHLQLVLASTCPLPYIYLKTLREAAVQFWAQVFFAQGSVIVIEFLQL